MLVYTHRQDKMQREQTFAEVSITERLQDAVHGPHVEQETKLSDGHGHQTEQEDRAAHGFKE